MTETRMGRLIQVGEATEAIMEIIGRIRERFGIDTPAPWWTDKDHPDYDLIFRAFIVPHRGLVRVGDIDADPLAFDQALRELKVCQGCTASKVRLAGDKVVGMADCPMGRAVLMETGRTNAGGRPEMVPVKRGPDSAFTEIRRTANGWQWVVVSCTDSERRRNDIAARLGLFQQYGGMAAAEVAGGTPFDNQTQTRGE